LPVWLTVKIPDLWSSVYI